MRVYTALARLLSHSVVNRCSFHGDMVSPSVGSMVTIAVNKRSDWWRATYNWGAVPVGGGRLGEGVPEDWDSSGKGSAPQECCCNSAVWRL